MSKSFYLSDVKAVLGRFLPLPTTLGHKERFVVASGALLSLLFATLSSYLIWGRFGSIPLLVAPMGATSILIFALPSSPLAQPWSVCFGNFISASIGVACAAFLGHHPVVASLAVWLSILAMFATRSLHPPGGAVARPNMSTAVQRIPVQNTIQGALFVSRQALSKVRLLRLVDVGYA